MISDVAALKAEVEALKDIVSRMIVSAPVEIVDAEKGYRLNLGKANDGSIHLSPFYPHPETGKTSVPLKKDQVVTAINPGGDPRQGFLVRGGYSEGHPSPNADMEANVFKDAGVTITIKGGVLHIAAQGHVVVEAPSISLGGEGGKKVARVGDLVEVARGSSAGRWPIVEGSSVVTAVD